MIDLDDPATRDFLHSGCALLICTVGPDGHPHAARAWGLTVVDGSAGLLRVLAEAGDAVVVAGVRAGDAVAVTATRVPDFYSVQLKGRGVGVETLTADDEAKAKQYTDDFLRDVHEVNGYSLEMMHRWADRPLVPCLVQVDTSFDQTPGPSAGLAIGRGTS